MHLLTISIRHYSDSHHCFSHGHQFLSLELIDPNSCQWDHTILLIKQCPDVFSSSNQYHHLLGCCPYYNNNYCILDLSTSLAVYFHIQHHHSIFLTLLRLATWIMALHATWFEFQNSWWARRKVFMFGFHMSNTNPAFTHNNIKNSKSTTSRIKLVLTLCFSIWSTWMVELVLSERSFLRIRCLQLSK